MPSGKDRHGLRIDRPLSSAPRHELASVTKQQSLYRHERELVDEVASLLDPARRPSWLQQLRLEYKAKKNFVRDLPAQ